MEELYEVTNVVYEFASRVGDLNVFMKHSKDNLEIEELEAIFSAVQYYLEHLEKDMNVCGEEFDRWYLELRKVKR